MPFVRITLKETRPAAEQRAIADSVHRAMTTALGVPVGDRFQVVAGLGDGLIYDPTYLDIARSDGIVMIEITLTAGRSVALKKKLFAALADALEADHGIRREDVFVHLVEVARENWSFGNGIAQYADSPPAYIAALEAPAA